MGIPRGSRLEVIACGHSFKLACGRVEPVRYRLFPGGAVNAAGFRADGDRTKSVVAPFVGQCASTGPRRRNADDNGVANSGPYGAQATPFKRYKHELPYQKAIPPKHRLHRSPTGSARLPGQDQPAGWVRSRANRYEVCRFLLGWHETGGNLWGKGANLVKWGVVCTGNGADLGFGADDLTFLASRPRAGRRGVLAALRAFRECACSSVFSASFLRICMLKMGFEAIFTASRPQNPRIEILVSRKTRF